VALPDRPGFAPPPAAGVPVGADEQLYGWGEQFGAFARTAAGCGCGHQYTVALQRHRSYSAVPFFISRRGYGVLLLNASPSRWHIDPRRRTLSVEARSGTADYLVILGETPKEILTVYTGLTGRPPL
jgi:alpha-D-xyloside xylohydrolase